MLLVWLELLQGEFWTEWFNLPWLLLTLEILDMDDCDWHLYRGEKRPTLTLHPPEEGSGDGGSEDKKEETWRGPMWQFPVVVWGPLAFLGVDSVVWQLGIGMNYTMMRKIMVRTLMQAPVMLLRCVCGFIRTWESRALMKILVTVRLLAKSGFCSSLILLRVTWNIFNSQNFLSLMILYVLVIYLIHKQCLISDHVNVLFLSGYYHYF